MYKRQAFGSTKRGIAYAYSDKYRKKTIRLGDLLHLDEELSLIHISSKPGKVTIPFHKGKELNKITENSIRKPAGIK